MQHAGQEHGARNRQNDKSEPSKRMLPSLVFLGGHRGQHEDERQRRCYKPAQMASKHLDRPRSPSEVRRHQPVRPTRLTEDLQRQVRGRYRRKSRRHGLPEF